MLEGELLRELQNQHRLTGPFCPATAVNTAVEKRSGYQHASVRVVASRGLSLTYRFAHSEALPRPASVAASFLFES